MTPTINHPSPLSPTHRLLLVFQQQVSVDGEPARGQRRRRRTVHLVGLPGGGARGGGGQCGARLPARRRVECCRRRKGIRVSAVYGVGGGREEQQPAGREASALPVWDHLPRVPECLLSKGASLYCDAAALGLPYDFTHPTLIHTLQTPPQIAVLAAHAPLASWQMWRRRPVPRHCRRSTPSR